MSLLEELYINLESISDEEADSLGKRLYQEEFLNQNRRGAFILHDGTEVFFFEDRYEHAFHTSQNRIRNPYSKAKVATDRISRLKWIKPILEGHVAGTQCWQVADYMNRKRLYIVCEEKYIIWLEGRQDGNWKFSTAYVAGASDIKRYTSKARKIWEI